MKSHRDFVVLVKGAEEINALVVFSHSVTTPATQDVPAFDTEYLTVAYTNQVEGASWPSKDKILQNMQVEIGVPPVTAGKFFGWKDVDDAQIPVGENTIAGTPVALTSRVPVGVVAMHPETFAKFEAEASGTAYLQKSSGIDGDAGDWTQTVGEGKTDDTSPVVEKPVPAIVGPDGKTDAERGYAWGSPEHMASLRDPEAVAESDPTPVTTEPEPAPADPSAESPAA